MVATSLDLSAIKTDALSAASTFRTLIGLGTLATQSPTGTANSTTYLRGDFTWATVSGSAAWGSITGTLSSQTDLQNALDAKASLSGATFTGAVGINAGTLNGTVLDIAQTWGGTGTYTGIRYNVTDSGPSNAASLLMDLQVGGTSRFKVSKSGLVNSTTGFRSPVGNSGIEFVGDGYRPKWMYASVRYFEFGNATFVLADSGRIQWASGAISITDSATNFDLSLARDGAGILAQRIADAAGPINYPQAFRIYNRVDGTDTAPGSNWERAKIAWSSNVLQIGTEKLGTGAARALELQTDGTTRLTIGTDGKVGIGISPSYLFHVASTTNMPALALYTTGNTGYASADIVGGYYGVNIAVSSSSGYYALNVVTGASVSTSYWSGGTSRFKVNSNGNMDFNGLLVLSDATNMSLATTTGTKIGTATTQKLGFWNATPIVQPANTVAIDDVLVNTGLRASGGVNNFTNTLDLTIRTVTYGATMAIDAALGNKIAITLAGNGTISNPTNAVDGRVLVFRLRQDATGSRIPVWDTKYSFVGDLATVTLSTAANAIDRIAFEYDSTTDKWYCISFIKGS